MRQMSVLQNKLKKSSTSVAAGLADEVAGLSVEEAQPGVARGLGPAGVPLRVSVVRESEGSVVMSVCVAEGAAAAAVLVARTPNQLQAAQEALQTVFPEAAWPEAGAGTAAFLEAASCDEHVARSGELRELLLEPCAWAPLGAARAAASKTGPLVLSKGSKKRLAVLLGHRLLLYRETEERSVPHRSVSLFLASLEVTGDGELRLECPWQPKSSLRLRGEDRRDVLAWLPLLREARHRVAHALFFEGATHCAAEALPSNVAQLFRPLPQLQLDLEWRPSLSESWWPEDSPLTVLLNKEGRLRAASPAKLVERLLDETFMSHADVVSFLLTFESFLTPLELLDALASHFDRPQRGAEGFKMRPDQLRVITVVGKWLETCPQQFVSGDKRLASRLFGWLDWNFREDRVQPYRKMLKAGRHVYLVPDDTSVTAAAGDKTAAPIAGDKSSGAGAAPAVTEKEAMRAAVRARMAAQNAVLGEKSTSSSSAARSGSAVSPRKMSEQPLARAGTVGTVGRKASHGGETPAPAVGSPTAAGLRQSSHAAVPLAAQSGAAGTSSQDFRLSMSGAAAGAPEAPESILPAAWLTPHQDLFEVSPVEVARQITLIEFALFAATPLVELHGRGWLTGGATCPQLMKGIGFFNYLSHAVGMTVLRCPMAAQRAALVAWWLRVAAELRTLNNFSSTVAVMAGFAMSAVYRLSRTWSQVEKRHAREHASLAGLQALTSSGSNWVALRSALHSVSPPAIPYLGIYTSDLTFADQGNPSRIDGLVNWDKCKLEASIIRDVHLFQQTPYVLAPVPSLQALLWSMASDSDDTLYDTSLLLEPRRKGPQ